MPVEQARLPSMDGQGDPRRIEGDAKRWGLRVLRPIQLAEDVDIFLCLGSDGNRVVLKRSRHPVEIALETRALLRWTAIRGVIDVIESDPDAGVLVLPFVETAEAAPDVRAAGLFVAFATLFSEAVAPESASDFPPLIHRVTSAVDKSISRLGPLGVERPDLRKSLDRALGRARAMPRHSFPEVIVHGDLQAQNVLIPAGGRAEDVIIIDPKPHFGDRHFDAIDFVLAGVSGRREMEARLARLSTVPTLDAQRVIEWCVIAAPIIAARRLRQDSTDPSAEFLLDFASGGSL